MRRFRKITWTFVVVATAASTLFANLPLTVCACSPAPVRPEIVTNDARTSSCSCGNTCCSNPNEEGSCCHPKPAKTDPPTPIPNAPKNPSQKTSPLDQPTLKARDCQQAVLPTTTFSIEQRHTDANEVVVLIHSLAVAPICITSMGVPIPLSRQVHQVPPPTDLVVAFQHFII